MSNLKALANFLFAAAKWLPVLVTSIIFIWSWYAYTFHVVLFGVDILAQQITYLVIFNLLFVFSVWSYLQTIFTTSRPIPEAFLLTSSEVEEFKKANPPQQNAILAHIVQVRSLPVASRTWNGGFRFCEECKLVKPDRCHHCSICKRCIPKMDHHCPWVNNCVSFINYKYFVLFLGYAFFLSFFTSATTFPQFINFWTLSDIKLANETLLPPDASRNILSQGQPTPFNVRFHVLFLFFVATMLTLGLVFLFLYHIQLLINNRSTLESFRAPLMTYGPDRNAFNLGKNENLLQLFGRSTFYWLIPIYTTEGDGISFNLRPRLESDDIEAREELMVGNGPIDHVPSANSIKIDTML